MTSDLPLPSSIGDDTGFVTSPSSTEALTSASLSTDLDAFEPGNRAHARRGTVDMCAPRLADCVRSTETAGVDDRRAPSLDDRSPTASAAFPVKRARRCALPMKQSPKSIPT